MFFWAIDTIIVFAGLAMTTREGLWTNTLTLFNILMAGLIAFGFYSPIVVYLDETLTDGQHTYWLDFAVLWALYAFTFIILRVFTGMASKTRMRFKHPIDPIGGPIVGFIAANVLSMFVMATLHTAPMGNNSLMGDLVAPNDVQTASMISQPDAAWLRFMERMSNVTAMGSEKQDFSAKTWVDLYAKHRNAFDKSDKFIVKRTKS